MSLEWVPQGWEYIETDETGRVVKKHDVHGSLAVVEDGRSYSVWPLDPKGTHVDGWLLTFDNGAKDEKLAEFISWPAAHAFAEKHNEERQDQPDPNDGLTVPEE